MFNTSRAQTSLNSGRDLDVVSKIIDAIIEQRTGASTHLLRSQNFCCWLCLIYRLVMHTKVSIRKLWCWFEEESIEFITSLAVGVIYLCNQWGVLIYPSVAYNLNSMHIASEHFTAPWSITTEYGSDTSPAVIQPFAGLQRRRMLIHAYTAAILRPQSAGRCPLSLIKWSEDLHSCGPFTPLLTLKHENDPVNSFMLDYSKCWFWNWRCFPGSFNGFPVGINGILAGAKTQSHTKTELV